MARTTQWFGLEPAAVAGLVFAAVSLFVSLSALRTAQRAVALTDRPFLAVEVNSIRLHDWDRPGRSVSFDVKDYGRSPALPVRVLVHAVVFKESYLQEQPTPIYRDSEASDVGGLIVPDQAMTLQLSGPSVELSQQAYTQWKAREPRLGNLFLYGYIDYNDVQGNSHRSCFAFRIVDWEPRPVYWLYVNNKAYWCST